ncbi:hypothetical protein LUZ60_016913 [Juncus effusus]|nr:hypothetical protein LUZ60_016913 [Juncus effusus]
MAVHAHYPPSSNLLLLDRADQEERKETMDLRFSDAVGGKNLGKRARETSMANPNQIFSQQAPAGHNQSGLVSTGLRLAFDEHQQIQMNHHQSHNTNNNNNSTSFANSSLSEELFTQMAHQTNEIEIFLIQQGEQLRRALAEKRRRHYKAFFLAAEEQTARKVRQKQAELDQASRRTAELESRLNQLRSESLAWQTKALADQATAASLHAQLQQATQEAAAAANRTAGECEAGPADDAESGFIDPSRSEPERLCRSCRLRPACVVVFPCRHLCLCEGCEAAAGGGDAGDTCPVCCCVRSGSLKVFFS